MKNYLLAALAVCLFASCSSDPPNTPSAGTKLVKVLELDSADFTDSSFFDLYTYDNLGRVSFIYWDNMGSTVAHFYYNGNENRPYRMDGEANESTHYFSYTNDGKILKDSSVNIYNQFYHVYRYSYPSAAQVIVTAETWDMATGSIYNFRVDSLGLDGNANMISRKEYLKDVSSGAMELLESSSFTYDNKTNPLFNLNISLVNKYANRIETINEPYHFQANNCTRREWRSYFGGAASPLKVETFSCSYFSNNYIKDFTATSSYDPTIAWKDIFYYE